MQSPNGQKQLAAAKNYRVSIRPIGNSVAFFGCDRIGMMVAQ